MNITASEAARRAAENDLDWALIRAIARGDQQALTTLYKRHYDYLYRFVFQVTRRSDVIDEVINEVMFVVWQHAAKAEPRALATTWILCIARRKALKTFDSGKRGLEEALEEDDPRFAAESNALREVDAENLLFVALRDLTPEQRAIMELVYYQGLDYHAIAEIMDCSENTVKTRIFHARRKLREKWPSLTGSGATDSASKRSTER